MGDTIERAKKSVGIFEFWLKTNLNLYQKVGDLTMEFYQLIQEAFKEGNSLDDFYEKWLEVSEKARHNFIGSSQAYEVVSDFIEKNTEFIKSTRELYQMQYAANGYSDSSSEGSDILRKVA